MGRVWLGATHDARVPVAGDARAGLGAVPDGAGGGGHAAQLARRLNHRAAQQHGGRDVVPVPTRDDRPRWLNWLARR